MAEEERRRRRRPLPGEGSDRLGTNFDRGLPGSSVEESISYTLGEGAFLNEYAGELVAMAREYRRNLEEGHLAARRAVGIYQNISDLRAFWNFASRDHDDNVYDLSGQGRTLTRASVTFGSAGQGNFCPIANFGAVNVNRYFSRANEDDLNWTGNSHFTFLAWFAPQWASGSTGLAPIVSKGDEATGVEYGVHVDRTTMRLKVAAGNKTYTAPATRALTWGAWNFIQASFHSILDTFTVRVNTKASTVQANTPTLTATTDPFYVGRHDNGASTEYVEGQMALLAMYDTLLHERLVENVWEGTRTLFGV